MTDKTSDATHTSGPARSLSVGDNCPNADGYWRIYDWETFGRVKEVQREIGQEAAERLAGEFKDGVLA